VNERSDEEFADIVRALADPSVRAELSEELARLSLPRRRSGPMPEGWYVIRVELLSGRGQDLTPPPGRDLLVSPNHTFRQLAELINASFARWDLRHLYVFRMADGTEIGGSFADEEVRDAARTRIARRATDEAFEFEFDFGDSWLHRCTVLSDGNDPADEYGVSCLPSRSRLRWPRVAPEKRNGQRELYGREGVASFTRICSRTPHEAEAGVTGCGGYPS